MLRKDLNLGRLLMALLILGNFQCRQGKKNFEEKIERVSEGIISKADKHMIYAKMCDSLKCWIMNRLSYYQKYDSELEYHIDSTLCFNKDGTRLVTCIIQKDLGKISVADGIDFFYGERINEQWYFWRSGHIVIPRSMLKSHGENKALSYELLHQIALREVYARYLTNSEEINEEWFTSQFEGPGWADYKETDEDLAKIDRKEYEKRHLEKIANNWYRVHPDSVKKLSEAAKP
jgi:hypothetical protein